MKKAEYQINGEQENQITKIFQEKVLNLVNKFVFPVLYKVFLAYYEPCLNLEKIKAIKEPLIIHLQE